jgi:hypothetical protein
MANTVTGRVTQSYLCQAVHALAFQAQVVVRISQSDLPLLAGVQGIVYLPWLRGMSAQPVPVSHSLTPVPVSLNGALATSPSVMITLSLFENLTVGYHQRQWMTVHSPSAD